MSTSQNGMTEENTGHVSIVVVGASGDLAKRKTFPALFYLFQNGLLPGNCTLVGFARTKYTHEQFRHFIMERLTCRVGMGGEKCADFIQSFLAQTFYISGMYDSDDSFQELDAFLKTRAKDSTLDNRIFYLATPPSIFLDVAGAVGRKAQSTPGSNRVVIEKPFGRDAETSKTLGIGLGRIFSENQIYRIDHYLGKELVLNLMVLRFGNLIFEPIWNRNCVSSVQVIWKEEIGIEGRGGYFDQYGLIRDVMQNHLLQMLALVAMEPPVSNSQEDIRDEKVKVLRSVEPLREEDLVIGQYKGTHKKGVTQCSYLEEKGVAKDSRTETFAAAVLQINNRRWDGVPFLLKCGKAMDEQKAEIRVQFNAVPGHLFGRQQKTWPRNELVIRIQPNEGIHLRIMNKVPGLQMHTEPTNLDLLYKSQFQAQAIPDAYERLILDVIHGDKSLFIRDDELEAAWNIFTPALHMLDKNHSKPKLYSFGSRGPPEAEYLAAKYGVQWSEDEA